MDLTKLGYFAKSSIRFFLLISFIIIWYFWYFVGAFEEFRTEAITTVVRNEKGKHLVSPTILICSNTAFKPSMSKEYDYPLRSLFWELRDSQQIKDLFKNQSVLNVFYNLSYGHDLTFSILNRFVLKPGMNYFDLGGNTTVLAELKIIPTLFHGTCQKFVMLECTNCPDWTFDISYNEKLDKVDIPKSLSIYITSKNGWKGIVSKFTGFAAAPILKFNTFSSGIKMPLELDISLVENLHQYSEVDDFDSDECKKSLIKEIVNHFKASCSIVCIPVQFSALVEGYYNSMCFIKLIINKRNFRAGTHTIDASFSISI